MHFGKDMPTHEKYNPKSTSIGGAKNPPVAILATKPIKRCYNWVAIYKKIGNPATTGWYIPNLIVACCKIILLYFIPLWAHSLFPIFFSLSQPPFLSLLSSHPLSPLYFVHSFLCLDLVVEGSV